MRTNSKQTGVFSCFKFSKAYILWKIKRKKTDIDLEDYMMNKKSPEQKVNLPARWWEMEGKVLEMK